MKEIYKEINETLFKQICKCLNIEYFVEMTRIVYINKNKSKKYVFIME